MQFLADAHRAKFEKSIANVYFDNLELDQKVNAGPIELVYPAHAIHTITKDAADRYFSDFRFLP